MENCLLLIVLSVAVVLDFRFRRISNRLIVCGILMAIGLHLFLYGGKDILTVLWNISFPVIVLYLFYLVGALGAGDIKLFSVIGGFVSWDLLVRIMLLSLFIGGVESLLKLLVQKDMRQRIRGALQHLVRFCGGDKSAYPKDFTGGKNLIHFSLPMLLGTIGAMLWELHV